MKQITITLEDGAELTLKRIPAIRLMALTTKAASLLGCTALEFWKQDKEDRSLQGFLKSLGSVNTDELLSLVEKLAVMSEVDIDEIEVEDYLQLGQAFLQLNFPKHYEKILSVLGKLEELGEEEDED